MRWMSVAERLTGRLPLQKQQEPTGEVTGLDFSESMLEAGRPKVADLSEHFAYSRECDGITVSRQYI